MSERATSRRNRGLFIVIIFAAVVLIVVGGSLLNQQQELANQPTPTPSPQPVGEVFCYIGSEKADFLENPAVVEILRDRYNLAVDFQTEGSIEQARRTDAELAGVDCLWPSNSSAVEVFEAGRTDTYPSQNIFNTAMVIYSWPQVVEPLVAQGLITNEGDYYTIDMQTLAELLTADPATTWADLGIGELYGTLNVHSSDPTASNSGHLFYAMLANMLNGSPTPSTLAELQSNTPLLQAYYERQGDMFHSSGDLFEHFIVSGWGTYPLMANYEFLRIELMLRYASNPAVQAQIRDQIKVIYPQPTVWSSHPVIALTDGGRALIQALQDEDIQRIAWEQHGLRSGISGIENDPAALAVDGIPEQVTSIMNLPRADVMIRFVELLEAGRAP
ncbi:MAG: substrate-binding domain-containing protein [Anaerolineae bacterium]|nr:substrate-binding domain-containing protein [Anaerolineae bacterium]